MKHTLISITTLFLLAGLARAQDTPLSQIIIDGEGWKVAEKEAVPKVLPPSVVQSKAGATYMADAGQKMLRVGRTEGTNLVVDETKFAGAGRPTCVALWPDEGHLVVGDADGAYLWAFRIEKDGKLGPGDRYYSLRVKRGEKASGVSALTVDSAGRVYACTPLGVQVFDPTGRLSGVLLRPGDGEMKAVAFGGEKGDTLFVQCGDTVYARKTKATGVPPKK